MRVSVVLCTFNGERHLDAQLDSLLAQEHLPAEIVIHDDASTDGTWPRLQAFVAQAAAHGVTVVLQRNQVNLGYVRNFEQALQAASGALLFPCDQDDVWHRQRIGLCVQAFAADPQLLLLHTDARLVDADGTPLGQRLFQHRQAAGPQQLRIAADLGHEAFLARHRDHLVLLQAQDLRRGGALAIDLRGHASVRIRGIQSRITTRLPGSKTPTGANRSQCRHEDKEWPGLSLGSQ